MNLRHKLEDLAAIAVLFLVMLAFFGRILLGDQLIQSDIIQYKGMSSEIRSIQQEEGQTKTIHWTNSMFGGMPTYLISDAIFLKNNIAQSTNHLIRYFLPGPAGILMIAFVCFYILARSLSVSKWLSAIGAFAFGAGSFVIISLVAGHNSKINAYAYAPLILAGIVLIFNRKRWAGVFCLAFGLAAQLAANHYQITFYTFLICLCLFSSEAFHYFKQNGAKALLQPVLYCVLAVVLAVGVNYNKLATTLNHSKYTTRGASTELAQELNGSEKGGLDYDYATQWSYEPIESFTLFIPDFMGGASTEDLGDKSNWSDQMQIPQNLRNAPPTYWGNMPFTAGPVYLGAVCFALFVFALFVLNGRWKWWAIASVALLLLLGWGKYSVVFEAFFNSFPYFNKFRTPMMALLMLSLVVPLVGVQGADYFVKQNSNDVKKLYYGIGATALLTLLVGVIGANLYDFTGAVDAQLTQSGFPNNLINLLQTDRLQMLRADAWRSILFILLAGATLFAFQKDKIRLPVAMALLAFFCFADLFFVNKRYLTSENFESKTEFERRFTPSELDVAIQQDTTEYYRVLDMSSGNPFADASASNHHFSIGGYHAAKLQRYQDLIDFQLSNVNRNVLNMLNTKYVIAPTNDGQIGFRENDEALGNAWFVNNIVFTNTEQEMMEEVGQINLADSVLISSQHQSELNSLNSLNATNGSIVLANYKPDELEYDVSISEGEQFAVFSEQYYLQDDGDGWHAYANGRELDVYRVNYSLRGVKLPAGDYPLVFRYEHKGFSNRAVVSKVFSALLLLAGIGFLRERFLQEKRNYDAQ